MSKKILKKVMCLTTAVVMSITCMVNVVPVHAEDTLGELLKEWLTRDDKVTENKEKYPTLPSDYVSYKIVTTDDLARDPEEYDRVNISVFATLNRDGDESKINLGNTPCNVHYKGSKAYLTDIGEYGDIVAGDDATIYGKFYEEGGLSYIDALYVEVYQSSSKANNYVAKTNRNDPPKKETPTPKRDSDLGTKSPQKEVDYALPESNSKYLKVFDKGIKRS